MKWFRKPFIMATILAACVGARADLSQWAQMLESNGIAYPAFFKQVSVPGGPVMARRAPAESRAELTKLLAANAANAELHALRAREAELQMDYAAAESDWRAYVAKSSNKQQALVALAEYLERRGQAQPAIDTLLEAAALPSQGLDRVRLETEQPSWKLYDRASAWASDFGIPTDPILQARVKRYPESLEASRLYIAHLLERKDTSALRTAITDHRTRFPQDTAYLLETEADVVALSGDRTAALRAYEQQFQPAWSAELARKWVDFAEQNGQLRPLRERLRNDVQRTPADFIASTKLFHYWHANNDPVQAALAILRWKQATPNAPADQLSIAADLLVRVNRFQEAAQLYEAANTPAKLARLLLEHPEQPIRAGSNDLTFYREIANADPGPGFANAALSLLLNTQYLPRRTQEQELGAVSYFHRAEAARLIDTLPANHPERPSLELLLLEAYALHGASDGVISRGTRFLSSYPQARERKSISLLMADAYARKKQTAQEFELYERMLAEFATQSGNVPIGDASMWTKTTDGGSNTARSVDYATVLDRYIKRLSAEKQDARALQVYRRELDRNPNDPGLYERLAQYLQQSQKVADVEQVYQRARKQFADTAWTHKLARWYLSQSQRAKLSALTNEVIQQFAGSDLQAYFQQVLAQDGNLGAQFALQVNLAAAKRFPRNLTFVRNLVDAYSRKETANDAEVARLLRENWFLDETLKNRYFERLSRTGRLAAELEAARAQAQGSLTNLATSNPVLVQMLAEGEIWRGHYEQASEALRALAAQAPADESIATRAVDLERSLGAYDNATALQARLAQAQPAHNAAHVKLGELYADQGQWQQAREAWRKAGEARPGSGDNRLEVATVFWDYYRFADAREQLDTARRRSANASAYAYEYGAILEYERRLPEAIAEYARGLDDESKYRLEQLAKRPSTASAVEQATRLGPTASAAQWTRRIEILTAQSKEQQARQELLGLLQTSTSAELLDLVATTAFARGWSDLEEGLLTRRLDLATDPVEKLRLRIEQAKWFEQRGDTARAGSLLAAVLRENPRVLGVIRAGVDFYERTNQLDQAVSTLENASRIAVAPYKAQLLTEAAGKAQEAKRYAKSRELLDPLLREDAYRGEWLELYALSLQREGKREDLDRFYRDKLQGLQAQNVSNKQDRVAQLRRGYARALEEAGRHAEALDQYIEILNRFPQDESLLGEMTQYALRYGRQQQVLDYYGKAVSTASRDARLWAIKARFERAFEKAPDAAASYAKAIEIRPEELNYRSERAATLVRLARFDEAATEYARLFDLSYGEARWMEEAARNTLRAGKPADAVKLLERAYLSSAPSPERSATVARLLDSWGQPDLALPFAERALNGVTDWNERANEAARYAAVMVRLRRANAALDKLMTGPQPSLSGLATLGSSTHLYMTPEERVQWSQEIERRWKLNRNPVYTNSYIELARASSLRDLEARMLGDVLAGTAPSEDRAAYVQRLIALQQSRLRYSELGAALEKYAASLQGEQKTSTLQQAANVYQDSGSASAELRVRNLLPANPRTLELQYLSNADRLVQSLSAAGPLPRKKATLDLLIANEDGARSTRALESIAAALDPKQAAQMRALLALYFRQANAPVDADFERLLGPWTVGERLAMTNRDARLTGAAWYPFAHQYALWRMLKPGRDVELDLVLLEQGPVTSTRLADFAGDVAEFDKDLAARAYESALESKSDPLWLIELGVLRVSSDRTAALDHWRRALTIIKETRNDSFLTHAVKRMQNAGQLQALQPEIVAAAEAIFGADAYVDNGSAVEVARAVPALQDRLVQWLSRNPAQLESLLTESWLNDRQKDQAYRLALASALRSPSVEAQDELRTRYVDWLLSVKRLDEAAQQLAKLTAREDAYWLRRLQLGAAKGTLTADLVEWKRQSERPDLRQAAMRITDRKQALLVLEAQYSSDLERDPNAGSYILGLAEVRLEQGRAAEALGMLRRLTETINEPYEWHPHAARLLDQYQRPEAREYWLALAKANPWDGEARWRSAQEKGVVQQVAASAQYPYLVRLAAAKHLKSLGGVSGLGGGELDLVASSTDISPDAADKPLYTQARLEVAKASNDAAVDVRMLSIVLSDDPQEEYARAHLARAAALAKRDRLAVLSARRLGEASEFAEDSGAWTLLVRQLGESEARALLKNMALVNERLRQWDAAIGWWTAARGHDGEPAIEQAIETLQARLAANSSNESRRPRVSAGPEQWAQVRPREEAR